MTNLPWPRIEGRELESRLGLASVRLVNDFVGLSEGLVTLADEDVLELQAGSHDMGAPRLCAGAGTGLGECFLTWREESQQYEVGCLTSQLPLGGGV